MSAGARAPLAWLAALAMACGPSSTQGARTRPTGPSEETEITVEHVSPGEADVPPHVRQSPPAPGPARDVSFPAVTRSTLANGLEIITAPYTQLPIAYALLVVKTGTASDPAQLPGLASFAASMLKEGTRRRSSAQIAEEMEFLGSDLTIGSEFEDTQVMVRALADQLPAAMEIMADVVRQPSFPQTEIEKLRRRELDRLALQSNDADFIATREFYRAVYGDAHPYAHIDATPDATRRFQRRDLFTFHHAHFVANNAFLVVVGDVQPDSVRQTAERLFGSWPRGSASDPEYPGVVAPEHRRVIVVDRPSSVQTEIRIGNIALRRSDPLWIPLSVGNQMLGGSAASRLFMDLRERRSLTYGAYSRATQMVDLGPWRAFAAVRTEVTAQALDAFFQNLRTAVGQVAPADEIADARRYLSDSFPLRIDTPAKIATMIAEQRIYGLPDDYWERYRSRIETVTPEQAHDALARFVMPERAIVVLCGQASAIETAARAWGPVTVMNTDGVVLRSLDAAPAAAH